MLKLEAVFLCAFIALHLQGGLAAVKQQTQEMCRTQTNINTNTVLISATPAKPANKFVKIGKRYFYIEKGDKLYNWFAALNLCRQMGGHLATIQSEEELTAIVATLPGPFYWLGVTNLANASEYTSVVSGKKAPFLHWDALQPERRKHSKDENCIAIVNKLMHDYPCDRRMRFICEVEL